MSGDDYSDIFGSPEGGQSDGGGLRKLLEQALAENKKLNDRLNRKEREDSLTALLKEKGKDPGAVGIIPPDADPVKWLAEYGQYVADAKSAEAEQQGTTEPPEAGGASEIPQDERDALGQVLGMQPQAGSQAVGDTEAQIDKMRSFSNESELLSFIKSGGHV